MAEYGLIRPFDDGWNENKTRRAATRRAKERMMDTQHATCTWPNGEQRRVRHVDEDGVFCEGMNPVFWYDGHLSFEDVPFGWLSEFGIGRATKEYNNPAATCQ